MAKRVKKHVNVNQNANGKDLLHLVNEHSVLSLLISLHKVAHNGHDLQHARPLTVALILESLTKVLNTQWVQFAAINAKNISI